MSKEHKQLIIDIALLLARLDSEPRPKDELAESAWIGKQQVADKIREAFSKAGVDLR